MKFIVKGHLTVSCWTQVRADEGNTQSPIKIASERSLSDLCHAPFCGTETECWHFENDGEPDGLVWDEGEESVKGTATISCWTEVEAENEAAAIEIAKEREPAGLCDRPFVEDVEDSFHFDGDGVPFNLVASKKSKPYPRADGEAGTYLGHT